MRVLQALRKEVYAQELEHVLGGGVSEGIREQPQRSRRGVQVVEQRVQHGCSQLL